MTTDVAGITEADRLAAVRRFDILDTPPDGAFDRITAAAARIFHVPISIVSIVDTDRIWFKSHHGTDVEEIDREPGLCASAILQDGPWLLTDAKTDPCALANPLVAGEFGLRFYAGVPLRTHDGHNLGTLCVIDQQPRTVSGDELATLRDLASVVMDEIELRLSARRTISLEAELRRQAEDVAHSLRESLLPPRLPKIPGLEIESRYHTAHHDQVGGDFYDVVPTDDGAAIVLGDACGKGVRAAAFMGTARWTLRSACFGRWTPAQALTRLNQVLINANQTRSYATVALASIQPDESGGAALTLALAGHPRPLVVRSDGTVEPVGVTSPIVGWRPEAQFTESAVQLAPGEAMVLFTDGVIEALCGHAAVDQARFEGVLAAVAGATAGKIADTLDSIIVDGGLERDDAAFLVVRVP